jgi:hypothetical protein
MVEVLLNQHDEVVQTLLLNGLDESLGVSQSWIRCSIFMPVSSTSITTLRACRTTHSSFGLGVAGVAIKRRVAMWMNTTTK